MENFSIIHSGNPSTTVNLQSILNNIKKRHTPKGDSPSLVSSSGSPIHFQGSFLKAPNFYIWNHPKLKLSEFSNMSSISGSKSPSLTNPSNPLTRTTSKVYSSESSSRLEKLKLEQEEKLKKECTFSPSINKQKTPYISLEERINLLSKPKSELEREKHKRKIEDEEEAFRSREPSFASTPSSFPGRVLANTRSNSGSRLKTKKENEQIFTFEPKLNKNSLIIGNRVRKSPLFRRASEIHRQTSVPKERPLSSDCSFKPLINENSKKLAELRHEKSLKIGSASARSSKNISEKSRKENEESFEMPFSYFFSDLNFFERQKKLQADLEAKKKALVEKMEVFSYKPCINANSNYITQTNSSRGTETIEEKCERMSGYEAYKRELSNHVLAEELYSEYNFEPKINTFSREIGRDSSIENLVDNFKPKTRMLARQKALELERQCSFSPRVNQNYEKVESELKKESDISKNLKKHQEKLAEKKKKLISMAVFREMKECSFSPRCNSEVKLGKKNVTVKGMERVKELKAVLENEKAERKLREKKAFLVDSKFSGPFPYTRPVPFNIKPSKREEKVLKIELEQMLDDKKILTFKPALAHSQYKKNKEA